MRRPILDLTQCRTVRAVCRFYFATRLGPPVCDGCYVFMFDLWSAGVSVEATA